MSVVCFCCVFFWRCLRLLAFSTFAAFAKFAVLSCRDGLRGYLCSYVLVNR